MAAASGEAGRLSRAGPVGCLSAAALSRAADRRAGELLMFFNGMFRVQQPIWRMRGSLKRRPDARRSQSMT